MPPTAAATCRSSATPERPGAAPSAGAADGVLVVATGATVELQIHGAAFAAGDGLVSRAEAGGLWAVAIGRLYYRADVAARYGVAAGAGGDGNDAALALAVYRRGGTVGLEDLEGEFALIVVDLGQRRIVAMRDPHGGYPIYWCRRGETVVLGSSLRALAALVPDAALNVETLAEFVAMAGGEPDYHEGTVFTGIQRLIAGGMLAVDLAGGGHRAWRYWVWADRVVDPGTDDLEAIGARYADTLRAAVRERLRGTVAAHVSGGMDSTSVALIARDHLGARGQSLQALSLLYQRLDGLVGESAYVEAALELPGLVPHRIIADELLDFDSAGDTTAFDEPYAGSFRVGPDRVMIDTAAGAGCRTILTGMGADEVHDTAPFYIADLLRRGRPLRAWSQATWWARSLDKSPWSFFRRFGVAPLVAPALADGIGPWLRRGRAAWHDQSPSTIAPWIEPAFARRSQLLERLRARRRRAFPSASSVVLSDALGRLHHACGDWTRHALAAPRNIHLAHPFRDARVLALGLGARVRVRPTPQQQKPVLARAMRGTLPDIILHRRDKAHFNALYYAGLARNVEALEDMVRASPVDELGLFKKDVLIACLRDAALGYRGVAGTAGLDAALAIAKWLWLLPRWRDAPMVPVRVWRREIDGRP